MTTATPFLITLAEARTLLAGRSPIDFGIRPIAGRGEKSVYYRKAIEARLDELAGIGATGGPLTGGNDNDADDDGLGAIRDRLANAERP